MEKEKIEQVETDRKLTIRTLSGPVELVGPKRDLMKFMDQIEDAANRNEYLRCPPYLMTWAPWLEVVLVRPADIGAMVLINPSLAPRRKPGLLVPGGGLGGAPMAQA